MRGKIKIGVLLNNYELPAWEYKILEEIVNSDHSQIDLIVKNNLSNPISKGTIFNLSSLVFKLHLFIDSLFFTHKNIYSKKIDIIKLVEDVPKIAISQIEDGLNFSFNETDLIEIKKYDLDLILKFGFNRLKGQILKVPHYGVWAFVVGNEYVRDGSKSGYSEIVMRSPVTNIKLVILTEEVDEDIIIHSSIESTLPNSINLNNNRIFWRASLFIPRILIGLNKFGDSYLNKLINKNKKKESSTLKKNSSALSLLFTIRNLTVHLFIIGNSILKKIVYTDALNWIVLFRFNDNNDIFSQSFGSYKKLNSPKDRFWADPFFIIKNKKYYIFVEELIYTTGKGHISVIELDCEGNFLNSGKVIENPWHMSYPFILELDNNYYMIPETSQNRTIDLYKCTDFPYDWEFALNIMSNVSAVDTTLFYHNHKWWLFTSIDKTDNISGFDSELFLFFSEDIFSGKWESHPDNPIVTDARSARSAGAVFIYDGKIYRPSQDNSGKYARAFNLNQILILTETEYEEVSILKVQPDWNKDLKGTHTFNYSENLTVIDTYTYRKRAFFNRLNLNASI